MFLPLVKWVTTKVLFTNNIQYVVNNNSFMFDHNSAYHHGQ